MARKPAWPEGNSESRGHRAADSRWQRGHVPAEPLQDKSPSKALPREGGNRCILGKVGWRSHGKCRICQGDRGRNTALGQDEVRGSKPTQSVRRERICERRGGRCAESPQLTCSQSTHGVSEKKKCQVVGVRGTERSHGSAVHNFSSEKFVGRNTGTGVRKIQD